MKTTHPAFAKSSPRAIDSYQHAERRLTIALILAEERDDREGRESPPRFTVQAVGKSMLAFTDLESGCLAEPLRQVEVESGASRSTVEKSVRRLRALGLLRSEPNEPGSAPTYRWLRPVADRVISNALPNGSSSRNWLRIGLAATCTDVEPGEADSSLGEDEPSSGTLPAAATDAAVLWTALDTHDARVRWREAHAAWRARVLGVRTRSTEPTEHAWRVLLDFQETFAPAEQARAIELALAYWPEVGFTDKIKSARYPLGWLEHDLAALEPRVRRALTVATQREQGPADRTTVTGSPVSAEERRQLSRAALGVLNAGRAA